MRHSMDEIVKLRTGLYDEYERIYKETWKLLSPKQRDKLLEFALVAIQSE